MTESAQKARKAPWLVLGVLVVAAVGAAGYALFVQPGWAVATTMLERWKTADPANRKAVAEELIASKTLIGRSVEEIVGDLGQPDQKFEDRGDYEWKVGVEQKMGRNSRDQPAMQDEATYLKVKFVDGVATMANFNSYITDAE